MSNPKEYYQKNLLDKGFEYCYTGGDPNIKTPQQCVSFSSLWYRLSKDEEWKRSEFRNLHELVEWADKKLKEGEMK
jgi:hypothetical protein